MLDVLISENLTDIKTAAKAAGVPRLFHWGASRMAVWPVWKFGGALTVQALYLLFNSGPNRDDPGRAIFVRLTMDASSPSTTEAIDRTVSSSPARRRLSWRRVLFLVSTMLCLALIWYTEILTHLGITRHRWTSDAGLISLFEGHAARGEELRQMLLADRLAVVGADRIEGWSRTIRSFYQSDSMQVAELDAVLRDVKMSRARFDQYLDHLDSLGARWVCAGQSYDWDCEIVVTVTGSVLYTLMLQNERRFTQRGPKVVGAC